MLVNESIEQFKRTEEPKKSLRVGEKSDYIKERKFKEIENGIRQIDPPAKEIIFKHIDEYLKIVKNLNRIDIEPKNTVDINLIGNFEFNAYQIVRKSHVVFECILNKDVEKMFKKMLKHDAGITHLSQIRISRGLLSMNIKEVKNYFKIRGWGWV